MISKTRIVAKDFRPIKNCVFVKDLEHGAARTAGGVLLPDDNMTAGGIRSRWAQVYAVGPEIEDLKPGDWVLLQHGRWTNAITLELENDTVTVWRIDYPEAVLVMTEEDPRTTLPTAL